MLIVYSTTCGIIRNAITCMSERPVKDVYTPYTYSVVVSTRVFEAVTSIIKLSILLTSSLKNSKHSLLHPERLAHVGDKAEIDTFEFIILFKYKFSREVAPSFCK